MRLPSELFLIGTHLKILACLNNGMAGRRMCRISRATGVTYSYGSILLKEFEKKGLVFTTKIGRIRSCNITPKGKDLLFHLHKIIEILDKEEKPEYNVRLNTTNRKKTSKWIHDN